MPRRFETPPPPKPEHIKKREAFNNNLQHLLDTIDLNDLSRLNEIEGVGILQDGRQAIVKIGVYPLNEVDWKKRTDNGAK